jgi:hypothetical protein
MDKLSIVSKLSNKYGNAKPKQKFPRGSIVKVGNMPSYMSHFTSNFIGVVVGTYATQYGGDDYKSYTLLILDKNLNYEEVTSWYKEDQIELISDDTLLGEKIICSCKGDAYDEDEEEDIE